MATGGIFTIITNDGKQDRLLMATEYLQKRLRDITQARAADPTIPDPTPTLADIESTHILFTNAHFKPFAAIGYEYEKVQPSSGNTQLGEEVQFSIPQFGDFFHDMILHVKLSNPTLSTTATNVANQPLMRWCHFPGERLLKKVRFEVNGNPLDEYTSHAYNFYREFCVQPNKQTAWYRCICQELPIDGFVDQPNWVRSGVQASDITYRFGSSVYNGWQTPTGQKSASTYMELFIPLLFWFNKDSRLAIPSVSIPYGQRFITVQLAEQSEMVNLYVRGAATASLPQGSLSTATNIIQKIELYINNIFVNPEIHDIFIKRIGFSLIRVNKQQTFASTNSEDEFHLNQLKWPVETLFVGMKMEAYNSSTESTRLQHLDKWHTFHYVTETSFTEDGFNSLKASTLTGTNVAVTAATGVLTIAAADGAFTTEITAGDYIVVGGIPLLVTVVTDDDNLITSGATADIAATTDFYKLEITTRSVTANVCTPTLTNISITAHGIPIYNDFPARFFNAYMPYNYGGPNIRAPEDCGALMIPFNLYPGTYQPSGHINISRAREFYIKYSSAVIDSTDRGTLVVLASALNFLLISDGSAVLRYTT